MDSNASATRAREHIAYFDWLKVLVVYGIVVYHAALPFSYTGWLVQSPDRSVVLTAFTAFTFPWGIPLLFLLSGAAEYFGLQSRPLGPFLVRRLLRLGLPLAIGLVVLSPLQAYVVGSADRSLPGMIDYYPRFLGNLRLDWTPQWLGRYGYHLWFLGYLLGITVVTVPLMEWFRSVPGRRWVARLAAFSHRRGGVLVFAVPLAASQLVLRDRFPSYQDWADIATYTLAFVAGYVLISDRDFAGAIERNGGLTLKLGLVSAAILGLLVVVSTQHLLAGQPALQVPYRVAYGVAWSLNIWCWCVCVLYVGVRWLRRDGAIVRYGSESALPVYIISHPVVVVVASLVVGAPLPLWPRFLLLTGLSFIGTLAIYEFGVRRWNATRFLFGLKPLPSRTAPTPGPASSESPIGVASQAAAARPAPGAGSGRRPR